MQMLPSSDSFNPLVRLVLDKYSKQPIPLVRTEVSDVVLSAELIATGAAVLFPEARNAIGALSGLMLLLGDWERSHTLSQEDPTSEGSYWHAIAHRIEPDSSNAAYWFKRVGKHPVFPNLYAEADTLLAGNRCGFSLKKEWNPLLFLDWCDSARSRPNSENERLTVALQQIEWNLLFHWCALKSTGARSI